MQSVSQRQMITVIEFSNQDRPISAPNTRVMRPFSSNQYGYGFKAKTILQQNVSRDNIS